MAPYQGWQASRAVYDFVQDIPLGPQHPTWQTLGEIEDQLTSLADFPTLLIWGMRDWCFNEQCLDKFREYWPQANVETLEDAGHWVVEDAPDEVENAMQRFLEATTG